MFLTSCPILSMASASLHLTGGLTTTTAGRASTFLRFLRDGRRRAALVLSPGGEGHSRGEESMDVDFFCLFWTRGVLVTIFFFTRGARDRSKFFLHPGRSRSPNFFQRTHQKFGTKKNLNTCPPANHRFPNLAFRPSRRATLEPSWILSATTLPRSLECRDACLLPSSQSQTTTTRDVGRAKNQ